MELNDSVMYIIMWIGALPIAIFLFAFCTVLFKKTPKIEEYEEETPTFDKNVMIRKRDQEILGFYKDKPISKTVTLSDDSVFEFLSIAIEIAPEVFSTPTPDRRHIRVDDYLLYREIST